MAVLQYENYTALDECSQLSVVSGKDLSNSDQVSSTRSGGMNLARRLNAGIKLLLALVA